MDNSPIPCEYTSYNASYTRIINAFYLKDEREIPYLLVPLWTSDSHAFIAHRTPTPDILGPYGACLPNRDTTENDPSSVKKVRQQTVQRLDKYCAVGVAREVLSIRTATERRTRPDRWCGWYLTVQHPARGTNT